MNFNQTAHLICAAACMTLAASTFSSCNFSKEEQMQIAQALNGKEFFRDSKKWGKVVTETRELPLFTRINMNGNADVDLIQGDELKVKVTGNEKAIAGHRIEVVEENGKSTLVVEALEGQKNLPSIKLYVTVPDLESIEVNGNGDLEIKDDVFFTGNLSIHSTSNGDIEAKGIGCDTLNLVISNNGDVSAKEFDCTKAKIELTSNGDLNSDVKAENITVETSSNSEAELDVKCRTITVNAGGNSEVTLKGSCDKLTKSVNGNAGFDSRKLSVSSDIELK